MAISKNFTHLCDFNFCQIYGTGLLEQLENLFEKRLYNIQNFSAFDRNFLEFFAEKFGSVVKTELYDSNATFSRKILLIKKISASIFFELTRIIGLWGEGIQQDAKKTFYVIRETFWRKLFEKMLILLNCFLPWAKNSGPSGRNFLTA